MAEIMILEMITTMRHFIAADVDDDKHLPPWVPGDTVSARNEVPCTNV